MRSLQYSVFTVFEYLSHGPTVDQCYPLDSLGHMPPPLYRSVPLPPFVTPCYCFLPLPKLLYSDNNLLYIWDTLNCIVAFHPLLDTLSPPLYAVSGICSSTNLGLEDCSVYPRHHNSAKLPICPRPLSSISSITCFLALSSPL